jgi:hypothetical protein
MDEWSVGFRSNAHLRDLVEVSAKKPSEVYGLNQLEVFRVMNRDKGTTPLTNHQQPFLLQLGINSHDGLDVQICQDGHLAQGRQAVTVSQESGVQAGNDLIAGLLEETLLAATVETNSHCGVVPINGSDPFPENSL